MILRLLNLFPSRVITPDCPEGKVGRPLMTRWFILRWERCAIFVHQFHRSDLDEFHDHPWNFITFLISSGYWEHTPTGRHWRRRFSILYRPATYQHFIEIPGPLYTVFIRFRKVRSWGFWMKGKWVYWKDAELAQSRSICEDE